LKKILIVVDYQNDFVCGSYGFKSAFDIEDSICNKIDQYTKSGDDVLFTLDTHFAQDYETNKSENTSDSADSFLAGWELFGRVKKLKTPKMHTISKHTTASLDLGKYLLENQFDVIEFVGVVTNKCVIANAIVASTVSPEAEIIVDATCVASDDELLHKKALEIMATLNFTVINTELI